MVEENGTDEFDSLFGDNVVKIEDGLEPIKADVPKSEKSKRPKVERIKKPVMPGSGGSLHILNEKNVLIFVKQVRRTKKYELKHRFYNESSYAISNLVDKLIVDGKLQRFNHGWIGIKE